MLTVIGSPFSDKKGKERVISGGLARTGYQTRVIKKTGKGIDLLRGTLAVAMPAKSL